MLNLGVILLLFYIFFLLCSFVRSSFMLFYYYRWVVVTCTVLHFGFENYICLVYWVKVSGVLFTFQNILWAPLPPSSPPKQTMYFNLLFHIQLSVYEYVSQSLARFRHFFSFFLLFILLTDYFASAQIHEIESSVENASGLC